MADGSLNDRWEYLNSVDLSHYLTAAEKDGSEPVRLIGRWVWNPKTKKVEPKEE